MAVAKHTVTESSNVWSHAILNVTRPQRHGGGEFGCRNTLSQVCGLMINWDIFIERKKAIRGDEWNMMKNVPV